jgi:hypothetical protein
MKKAFSILRCGQDVGRVRPIFTTHIFKHTLKTSCAHATHVNDANHPAEDADFFHQEPL